MVNILAGVILVWLIVIAILVPIVWLNGKMSSSGGEDRRWRKEVKRMEEEERFKAIRAATGGWDWETFPYIPALVMTVTLLFFLAGFVNEVISSGFTPVSYADRHADHVAINRTIPQARPVAAMTNISPTLLQKVKDQLERFSDIPLPYGRTYERELELRARGLIGMIDEMRVKEAIAMIEGEK